MLVQVGKPPFSGPTRQRPLLALAPKKASTCRRVRFRTSEVGGCIKSWRNLHQGLLPSAPEWSSRPSKLRTATVMNNPGPKVALFYDTTTVCM